MPGLVYVLRDERRLVRGQPADAAIQLIVDVAKQQLAFEKVIEAIRKAEGRLGPGLCFSQCSEDQVPVDFAVMLADIQRLCDQLRL